MHERIVVRARGTAGGGEGDRGGEANAARGDVRTERVYPVLLVRDGVVSVGMISAEMRSYQPFPSPSRREPASADTPNSVKTLRYSCLDIVKPHFQHRHYVKHVAEADKSNNGLSEATG